MNTIQDLLSLAWVQQLGWTLIQFLWQGTLISVVFAIMRALAGRSLTAHHRYILACATLLAMVAAPIATFFAKPSAPPLTAWPLPSPDAWQPVLPWLVAAWLVGVAVFSTRQFGAWRLATRLRSVGVHPAPLEWRRRLEGLMTRIGIARPVTLMISSLVEVPAVTGWLRPMILIPASALTGMTPQYVEALLAHELAHVRRFDYLVNILQSMAEAVLFYHPAVWWISNQIRAERELCCDDVAVAVSGDVLTYARALAALESCRPAHANPVLAANGGPLLQRIRRLLGQKPAPSHSLPGIAEAGAMSLLWLVGIGAAAAHGAPIAPPLIPAAIAQPQPAAPPMPVPVEVAVNRPSPLSTLLFSPYGPAPEPQAAPAKPPAPAAIPQTFEIRGTVTDPSTNHLMEGVNVNILPGNGILAPGVEAIRLTTDSQGAFRFQTDKPGQYVVRVGKEGYTRMNASTSRGGVSDQGSVTFGPEKTSAEFQFQLQRATEITGRVVDDETGQPLANFRLGLAGYGSINGIPRARGGTFGGIVTGADGTFRRSPVIPGEHLLEVRPQVTGNDHILTQFTPEDVQATDLDYRGAFFPGGPGLETALPVRAVSGSSNSFGTLRVKKEPLYRVLIDIDPASCPPGETLTFREIVLRFGSGDIFPRGPIPCGPFLLTHMTPGTYELQIRSGQAPNTVGANLTFTVINQNLEFPIALSRGFTVDGVVRPAEGAGDLPLTEFKVSFGPIGVIDAAETRPHAVDAEGRFSFPNVQVGRRRVVVAGLGTEYYIEKVRYRGLPVESTIFDYDGSGALEVEIGRSPAAISGTVTAGDRPVPGADVVFMRWPRGPEDDLQAIRHIAADDAGKFRITGIVPGEYRIFAVAAADRERAETPLVWQRLLERAEKLTLTRGASPNINLQAGDPAR